MCEWERRLFNNNYKQIMRIQENIQLNTACLTPWRKFYSTINNECQKGSSALFSFKITGPT